jgi:hypothetical protein
MLASLACTMAADEDAMQVGAQQFPGVFVIVKVVCVRAALPLSRRWWPFLEVTMLATTLRQLLSTTCSKPWNQNAVSRPTHCLRPGIAAVAVTVAGAYPCLPVFVCAGSLG